MHDDPFRIPVFHKNDFEGTQWKVFSSTPNAPEPDPVKVAAGILLNIEGTAFHKRVAAAFRNVLSVNCSNKANLKSVNKKPFYEITDHTGSTISMDDIILKPEVDTHLGRTKHGIDLSKRNEERYYAACEATLIRSKKWREVCYYEEANLIIQLWDKSRRQCLRALMSRKHLD
ncbi:hypothetical protein BDV41DRAFT_572579 [Aspergillus transmontanensis]|uniref:Uncharacterized protein n=1 Tax=Aspergillus transmontanensis TaxID=1034304 RepID=A0A5N6WE80_9EURO|nr:hypothetical protein BDV41DRAFT_572579 [Aspergillus transmontanensis]